MAGRASIGVIVLTPLLNMLKLGTIVLLSEDLFNHCRYQLAQS
jgi:hypothetical protein